MKVATVLCVFVALSANSCWAQAPLCLRKLSQQLEEIKSANAFGNNLTVTCRIGKDMYECLQKVLRDNPPPAFRKALTGPSDHIRRVIMNLCLEQLPAEHEGTSTPSPYTTPLDLEATPQTTPFTQKAPPPADNLDSSNTGLSIAPRFIPLILILAHVSAALIL